MVLVFPRHGFRRGGRQRLGGGKRRTTAAAVVRQIAGLRQACAGHSSSSVLRRDVPFNTLRRRTDTKIASPTKASAQLAGSGMAVTERLSNAPSRLPSSRIAETPAKPGGSGGPPRP